jgi:hypothetical protein
MTDRLSMSSAIKHDLDFDVTALDSDTRSSNSDTSSSSSSISESRTFLITGRLEDAYEPIEEYEGRHRYDPKFQWAKEEEKKLVRKIDLRICAWVCLTFFALQLDRANIVQALSDNMLQDLGMNTNNYNTGQTIFYICFLTAELPSQLISKKLGPDVSKILDAGIR